jgi:hypothetical protein
MEGATSISIISPVDMEVESFPLYIYIPTPWAKHTKTTVRGAPSLENLSCSKIEFSLMSPLANSDDSSAEPASLSFRRWGPPCASFGFPLPDLHPAGSAEPIRSSAVVVHAVAPTVGHEGSNVWYFSRSVHPLLARRQCHQELQSLKPCCTWASEITWRS